MIDVVPDYSELASDSPRTYLAIAGLIALDAVLPVAPSETLIVAAGVEVERGNLSLAVLIVSAAAGALAGHSILYWLGRLAGPRARARLFRGERARQHLQTAESILADRTWLLIVSDFIPGGRTAAMFSAGALGLSASRFYSYVIAGAVIWASFYSLLGLAGGAVFERRWQALAASISAALLIGAAAEGAHRLRRSRGASTAKRAD